MNNVLLVEKWTKKKGSEPWLIEDIAELIVDASNIGKRYERERIIALLQSELSYWANLFEDSDGYESNVGSRYGGAVVALDDAVALIKGENE